MAGFKLEAWTALAPSLEHKDDWLVWLKENRQIDDQNLNVNLKHVPMMLRRRFNTLGKCAMGAIKQLSIDNANLPCIFASQHGDTQLTLSLLENIGKHEDMSPTGFSLAVHNAVSGLYSIVNKNTCEVTAIAAMEGLIASALFESIGQLQKSEKVLCVVYDVPLPSIYQAYSETVDFPYAIAMVLSRDKGDEMSFTYQGNVPEHVKEQTNINTEIRNFVGYLSGQLSDYSCNVNGSIWKLEKKLNNVS
ncbi:beta-ketoacyl synthase chain length factor [Aliiglaciecola lipolytica]|uniref:Beta-ketoacyl synthase-like N-terminal domain-containing protein n=1 Tax=Aliiglaciecola lipolytica E3 TaxID=1127673 RepID=K6WXE0_9ALTE|nr:beta-ketoacyl synthase chain length factor [Aliiglaciecola lipolytica]GAC13124.1 hypothetical protein GLIP_0478 [Aliiglaciecola lipolytica E3]